MVSQEDKFSVRRYGAGIGNSMHRAERPSNYARVHGGADCFSVNSEAPEKAGTRRNLIDRMDINNDKKRLEGRLQTWIENREATSRKLKNRGDTIYYNTLTEEQKELFGYLISYKLPDLGSAPRELKELYDTAERFGQVEQIRKINNYLIQYMRIMDVCMDKENKHFIEIVLSEYQRATDEKIIEVRRNAKKFRNVAKRVNKRAQGYLDSIRAAQ